MLDPYLDNELLVETSRAVLDHLSFCSDCAAESERRIELGRLVKGALKPEEDDELESENLSRKRIQRALDRERQPRKRTTVRWLALAAGLIVVLGLVYWRMGSMSLPGDSAAVNTPTSQSAVIADMDRDAVENHQACALSYPPTWAFDLQRVKRGLTPRFAPLIEATNKPGTYDLIEGHICRYQQRQYAHLIFRGNGHTVSVFIERDEPGADPERSRPQEIDQASYKAYQVASVDTGLHRIFVVSDLPTDENLALANQLFPSTLGFVKELEIGAS